MGGRLLRPTRQTQNLRIFASNLTCLFFPMPATMSLIRRLSSRAKKSTGEQLRKLSSLTHRQSSSESIAEDDECCCALPEDLLFRIVDLCVADAPLDVFRWRAVSRAFRNHVDRDVFGALTELDAKKDDLEAIVGAEECWQKPSGAHIAIRVSAPKVEIIVDRCWTSKDVAAACGAMNAFRHNVQKVTIDAPISELIVVSLSMIDLSRWYAFQCFMKAVNDHEMHLARGQVSSAATPSASEYWPFVTHLAIRTTEKDSNHLARIIDYGVRSQFVINRRVLQDLRVVLTDVASSTQCLQRNLYHFRCWAGSAGFDDRFSQQYGVVAIQ
ncbi:hypothetical protein QR680_008709 [Steinernema hermaphroditum]|uniref:F-box domain-containing protein n=1 Tax=Steinernema hermaphroditum TaxID=289476 RepID=A0AA39M8D8_9BILA|nr:hypothetical protein QR680_008709 [Steinernema hermaphroditum]